MTDWRRDQIEIARRNIANGIPDSRWCGNADCDLNGMEHGHRQTRHPNNRPAPIDLGWVTTEPVHEGPKWLNWTLLGAKLLLLCMLAAIAVAVVVKA